MTDIFTLFRKIEGLSLKCGIYLILGGFTFGRGFIFGRKFVLGSRVLIFRGLVFGGLIFEILRYSISSNVCRILTITCVVAVLRLVNHSYRGLTLLYSWMGQSTVLC